MRYYLYLDESGILHPNSKIDHFVYAGLLVDELNRDRLANNYKKSLQKYKMKKNIKKSVELKASKMNFETRKYLLSNLRHNCVQVFSVEKIRKLKPQVFESANNITRHQDYVIFKMIEALVFEGKLKDCEALDIYIDNQNMAVIALDNLEAFLHIAFNEDSCRYAEKYKEQSIDFIEFRVKYLDSKGSYLIQAADLLANTKLREYTANPINNREYRFLQRDCVCVYLPEAYECPK